MTRHDAVPCSRANDSDRGASTRIASPTTEYRQFDGCPRVPLRLQAHPEQIPGCRVRTGQGGPDAIGGRTGQEREPVRAADRHLPPATTGDPLKLRSVLIRVAIAARYN